LNDVPAFLATISECHVVVSAMVAVLVAMMPAECLAA
jgi:hypothetical protein